MAVLHLSAKKILLFAFGILLILLLHPLLQVLAYLRLKVEVDYLTRKGDEFYVVAGVLNSSPLPLEIEELKVDIFLAGFHIGYAEKKNVVLPAQKRVQVEIPLTIKLPLLVVYDIASKELSGKGQVEVIAEGYIIVPIKLITITVYRVKVPLKWKLGG